MPMTEKAGLWGRDLCKKGLNSEDKKIPESLGIVTAMIQILSLILIEMITATSNDRVMAEYNAAILSISLMTLLGFVDDVLELLDHPLCCNSSSCPGLLVPAWVNYHCITIVTKPIVLNHSFFGRILGTSKTDLTLLGQFVSLFAEVSGDPYGTGIDLRMGGDGWYYVYIVLLCIFCTNSINIYAGVNGLEVGQSIVIACSLLFINIIDILIGGDAHYVQNHIFSAMIIIPFIASSLALFDFNCYPARVFVGDTFTYSAGVTFAAVGIFGHFSKSLLLFFIPQLVNFLISLPQLFGLVPCPRHRLPKINPETGLLQPSVISDDEKSRYYNHINFTLINVFLKWFGPMSEKTLTRCLLILQVACSCLAVVIRYQLGSLF
ncbi:UDP-n-acetylglucosamine-dolichyl-phosphate [Blastocystis sp. subtype 4]|uniref:UDP-n-acetylglucosamine-dolichyl-phosphate n=1 Tax=Blastocystis sp. subtype 4 TaxID=944170 RepID=UPI0007115458|nr:UDP-n-acetylglucosamine-dolichyl-phosphate [Blastocystis sp. subtype 4]KNB41364.1 UDP-n-acetylglucosamine-dolichyl-phosphate [Blastocystis sp. subtype 4]|eukprot:XP_014524807.1 UDP-n-acetylglucosamine-dolichyl-phosphate [Blastocystis sp. subtype 4]